MTLHERQPMTEVGVRELHDHLSRYVRQAQNGAEIVVTMRGRRVARLVPVDDRDPLADLRARGLVREPLAHRRQRSTRPRLVPAKPVSDLVGVAEPLARHAGELAERHAYADATVHLACALALDAEDVVLATWDKALNDAAGATGRLLVNRTA